MVPSHSLFFISAWLSLVSGSPQFEEATPLTAVSTPSSTGLPVKPLNFGMLLFPSFEALDVFGPLDALNLLSLSVPLNLALIAETMQPVSTAVRAMNPRNSNFSQSLLPTHTFSNPPENLEVLFIPGGAGTRAPDLNNTIEFIRTIAPKVKYVITVCTGAGLAARAGVLDGRYATTNKAAWFSTIVHGPKTTWIPHARWVVDNSTTVPPFVWTTSGVAAGMDGTLAFISYAFGEANATRVANLMEYERQLDSTRDVFAGLYNLTEVVYPL